MSIKIKSNSLEFNISKPVFILGRKGVKFEIAHEDIESIDLPIYWEKLNLNRSKIKVPVSDVGINIRKGCCGTAIRKLEFKADDKAKKIVQHLRKLIPDIKVSGDSKVFETAS